MLLIATPDVMFVGDLTVGALTAMRILYALKLYKSHMLSVKEPLFCNFVT